MKTDERKKLPSASGLNRIALCPGSWLMERDLPSESGPDAEKGDKIHAVLAGAPMATLSEDEQDLVMSCKRCEDSALEAFKFRHGLGEPHQIIREERLWLRDFNSLGRVVETLSGKPDAVYLWERHALIIDYKTGRDKVPTQDNLQLAALAVLVNEETGCDIIGVAIVQPLAGKQDETWELDSETIGSKFHEIVDLAAQAQKPDQALIPSEDACKYCRTKSKCPAALGVVETLPATVPRDGNEIALSAEQIAKVLDAARVAEGVIESVRSKAKRMIEAGIEVPGWKLKPGAVKESVNNVPVLFQRFTALGGTQEQFIKSVKVTKKDLKDAVRDATLSRGKVLETHMETLLAGITDEKQNAPSLVKEGE